MSKLTGRSASPSGESRLDARLCAEIGAELARVREARGITVAEVSEKLLLSIRQVKALEEVDFTAFHNATFQLKAVRKYAQYAGLDPARIARLAASIATAEPDAGPREDTAFVAAVNEPRRGLRAGVSVLLVAAAVGGGFYLLRTRSVTGPAGGVVVAAQVPPAPAMQPVREPQVAPEPAPAPSTDASASPPVFDTGAAKPPAAFGTLHVLRPTWIFVRDMENGTIERPIAAGESFDFESQPTYLAVGTTDAELTIGGAPVDVARFVTNGQIRIRAGDFDALVQGASPIPAPTAAAR